MQEIENVLDKNPVSVKKGDIVKYGIRVYNEGAMDGYASEISEDVPEGLEFIWSEKLEDELNKDTTLTKSEKAENGCRQGGRESPASAIWQGGTDPRRIEPVEQGAEAGNVRRPRRPLCGASGG